MTDYFHIHLFYLLLSNPTDSLQVQGACAVNDCLDYTFVDYHLCAMCYNYFHLHLTSVAPLLSCALKSAPVLIKASTSASMASSFAPLHSSIRF